MNRPYLHPPALRIWHWLNAAIVMALIATGLDLRFHGIATLAPRDPALLWHKGLGLALIAVSIFWFVYSVASGNLRRHYGIKRGDLRGMAAQTRYYLGAIFTGGANPFPGTPAAKFNPLQKIAYNAVMFILLPIQAVTGLLFMNIPPLRDWLLAGELIGLLGAAHTLCSYLLILYLIVHLYMATLGETFFAHTRAMITGYEDAAQPPGQEEGNRT